MDQTDELLDSIDTLPPSPFPLPQLFKVLTEPDADLGPVVALISSDVALTAKLLQTCNTSFLGRSERVHDVAGAVNRLGFHTVYRVVAAVRGTQILGSCNKKYGIDPAEIWKHSVGAAFASQFLAEDLGANAGLFFTAGPLHDMGKVILGKAYQGDYARLIAETGKYGHLLVAGEKARFKVNHAEIGARLLARWNFSPEIVDSVLFHHHPSAAGQWERSAACVCLANALAHCMEQDRTPQESFQDDSNAALKILALSEEDLRRYSDRLNENAAFAEAMYRLSG